MEPKYNMMFGDACGGKFSGYSHISAVTLDPYLIVNNLNMHETPAAPLLDYITRLRE